MGEHIILTTKDTINKFDSPSAPRFIITHQSKTSRSRSHTTHTHAHDVHESASSIIPESSTIVLRLTIAHTC